MSMKLVALLNLEEVYQNSPNARIVPADVSSFTSKKQVNEFTKHIFMDAEIGVDLEASCECGHLTGLYLLDKECQYCKTKVTRPTASELTFTSWVEIPEFLPPMLQPAAYRILKKWMGSYTRQPLLDLLLLVESELPPQIAEWYTPGVWSFYNNFDKLMKFLINDYKPIKADRSEHIPEFLKKYKKCLFSRHFPILDRSMHVIDIKGTMSLVDDSVQHIMKSIEELANIHYSYEVTKDILEIEKYTFDMIKAYYDYSESIITNKLQRKYGLIRRQILGIKCHFTYRGVIVPIIDAADGDELYLPWGIGVQQHKLEILNLLINRKGYTPHEAQLIYERSKYNYNSEIDEILETLIDECPYKGIPTILGRNPTL
jgi:hypothetical protein